MREKWHIYRKDVTEGKGRRIIQRLIKNGKVWGKTVKSANIDNCYTILTKK